MDIIAKLPCRDANLYQMGVVFTVPVSPVKADAAEGRHDMTGHDAVYIRFCFGESDAADESMTTCGGFISRPVLGKPILLTAKVLSSCDVHPASTWNVCPGKARTGWLKNDQDSLPYFPHFHELDDVGYTLVFPESTQICGFPSLSRVNSPNPYPFSLDVTSSQRILFVQCG